MATPYRQLTEQTAGRLEPQPREAATAPSLARGPRLDPIGEAADAPSLARGPRLDPIGDDRTATPSLAVAQEIVLARRFGVLFRPVVEAAGGETIGLRPALRFIAADGRRVAARELFRALHAQPPLLFQAEIEVKRFILEHAPAQPLYLRVDADAWAADGEVSTGRLRSLLERHGTEQVVVEVVENRPAVDIHRLNRLVCDLAAHGLSVAASGLAVVRALPPDLLGGLDCAILAADELGGRRDARRFAEVHRVIEAVAAGGGRTLLTGVRWTEDLALARDLGFTAVCGPCLDHLTPLQVWEESYVLALASAAC
jgi:EAL domain-containing protein (putative c-di-GMP-specific phosphodiesterase class I)